MSGLILEIQKGALDESVSIETLLRRMKLAVAKLNLEELETWVESELNGYEGELPNYRVIGGQPVAWNPINGWIPIHAESEQLMDVFSTARIFQTVGSIEDLLKSSKKSSLQLPMTHRAMEAINSMSNFQAARMCHNLARGSLVTILSTVRNMILEWSIEMERTGVMGEGLSFSSDEKKQAQEAMATISIENFTGIMGSHNVSGTINSGRMSQKNIEEQVNKLREALPELAKVGANEASIEAALKQIDNEIKKTTPDEGLIRRLFKNIEQSLVGASGSLLADGAKAIIATIVA